MPRNHKLVPDALRSELDEYASLIRVLRTNDALDITSQLTRHSSRNLSHDAPQLQPQDDEGAQDVEEDQPSDSEHKGPKTRSKAAAGKPSTTPPKPSRKRKRPEARPKSSRPATKRDLWTRWPLLAGDVWPPQWGLQDEINSLVTHILKNRPLPPFPDSIPTEPFADADEESGMDIDTPPSSQLPQESQQDDSDSDIDVDMHPFVPYLTATSTHLLSTILSLLASHTPNRAASLQNRIEPMGWRSVLDVLSVYPDQNFVDENILQRVAERLQSVYPTPESDTKSTKFKASERAQISQKAHRKLSTALAAANLSLFELAQPPTDDSSDSDEPRVVKRARNSPRATKARAEKDISKLYELTKGFETA